VNTSALAVAGTLLDAHEELPLVLVTAAFCAARREIDDEDGPLRHPTEVRRRAEELLSDPAWRRNALMRHDEGMAAASAR
jgi:hypothetical protein